MNAFPSPATIVSDRLDLREFGPDALDLASEVVAAGQPEALPPGVPTTPDELSEWFASATHFGDRSSAVHLIMVDRKSGRLVGSIGVFHPDWEVRSAEIGYGVRSDERGKGYATEALAAVGGGGPWRAGSSPTAGSSAPG
jgi:RimJ/RimL family protein N-acetyltransferase